MAKLLSIISLILALVLFPPAALAVVSNNAVPGDATYPAKRGLEDVIYAVASLNPITKAWFAKARSDRRFQEITVLFTQGKKVSKTLNELVEQTQAAADQIDQVSNVTQKGKLISQLSTSITKYDQGLLQMSKTKQVPVVSVQPTSTPSLVLNPTPPPAISPSPSPTPDPDLERTREELERLRKRLEELERQRQLEQQSQQDQSPTSTPSPTLTPTLTPAPTPTLTLRPTPTPTPRGKKMEAPQKENKNFEHQNQAGVQSDTNSSLLEQE